MYFPPLQLPRLDLSRARYLSEEGTVSTTFAKQHGTHAAHCTFPALCASEVDAATQPDVHSLRVESEVGFLRLGSDVGS
jgi:hypothetical protein